MTKRRPSTAQVARYIEEWLESDEEDTPDGCENFAFVAACALPTGYAIGCVLCSFRGYRSGRAWSRLCPVRGCRGLLGYLRPATQPHVACADTARFALVCAVMARLVDTRHDLLGSNRQTVRRRRPKRAS